LDFGQQDEIEKYQIMNVLKTGGEKIMDKITDAVEHKHITAAQAWFVWGLIRETGGVFGSSVEKTESELSALLGISARTLRRKLNDLEGKGYLQVTRSTERPVCIAIKVYPL
jgi:AraC-like DNA-binding protein